MYERERYSALRVIYRTADGQVLRHVVTVEDGPVTEDFRVLANRLAKAYDKWAADLEHVHPGFTVLGRNHI